MSTSAPALHRGDTVTVHLVDSYGGERRVTGVVKSLGNAAGPLVVVVDETSPRCVNDDGAGACGHPQAVHGPHGCAPSDWEACWCDKFVAAEAAC
jgi:hypothetical protein